MNAFVNKCYRAIRKIGFLDLIPDEPYLKLMYRLKFGRPLDLKCPKTYNEKLQWIKLYDRKPEYNRMVDKYEAKQFVSERIGSEYIIPLFGVWNSFDEIDFTKLPGQFVLKCTHDCGGIVICRDKAAFDMNAARTTLEQSLKNDYFQYGREWPYKNVKPRIIAEQYMEDPIQHELIDYKFFTFGGKVKALFIAGDRFSKDTETKFDFYDAEFNHLDLINGHPNAQIAPEKPKGFEKMVELAEILSQGTRHLRVDFYNINGKIYFGELTFFHWSGFVPFNPESWDQIFGDWIEL